MLVLALASLCVSSTRCTTSLVRLVFFFKQKTAYEMRISDWSSDVCSSDLASGQIAVDEPMRAATAFLSLVVGGPARLIVAGNVLDDAELEARIRFAVGLFLRGVLRRSQ